MRFRSRQAVFFASEVWTCGLAVSVAAATAACGILDGALADAVRNRPACASDADCLANTTCWVLQETAFCDSDNDKNGQPDLVDAGFAPNVVIPAGSLGAPCNADGQCLSGHCVQGVCGDGKPGSGCVDKKDCASDQCMHVGGQGKSCWGVGFLEDGRDCHSDDTACKSGKCANAACIKQSACTSGTLGEICSSHNHCLSGICDKQTCKCTQGKAGDKCANNGDCASGVCEGTAWQAVCSPGGPACDPAKCIDANPCTSDGCGAAGACENKPAADGAPCGSNLTCKAGQCAASDSSAHFCDTNCGKKGAGCYCDSVCKNAGDCCDATGTKKAGATGTKFAGRTCAGSTCTSCK